MSGNLSAIELLELGDAGRTTPFLNKIWPQTVGLVFGLGTGAMTNFATRRPIASGIQKYVLATVGWIAVLTYVQKKRDDYLSEKDAVFRHYIQMHPEDFPTPERKKIGDVFEPWAPIR